MYLLSIILLYVCFSIEFVVTVLGNIRKKLKDFHQEHNSTQNKKLILAEDKLYQKPKDIDKTIDEFYSL